MKVLSNSREGIIIQLNKPVHGMSVVKVLTGGTTKVALHKALAALDPKGERFGIYKNKMTRGLFSTTQMNTIQSKVGKEKKLKQICMLSPSYGKLKPTQLNKQQYRHLRASVEMLAKNSIAHLDLPDNVMLNTSTGLPVIIDFGEGKLNASKMETQMDNAAFVTHFKKEELRVTTIGK